MLKTTLGQLMINQALPEELRDYERVLDKGGVGKLLQRVAETQPDKYRVLSKRLADIGRDAAYTTGGHSVGLRALRQSIAGRRAKLELHSKLQRIYAADLSPEERRRRIIDTVAATQQKLADEVLDESRQEDNPLARQLVGAGRGNKFQLNSIRGADLLYTDHRGEIVPIPVLRGYGQGMRPHEYFAGAFGARKGLVDVKEATQDSGFFSKQLVQAAHRLRVSPGDDDLHDDTRPRGLVADTDDSDNAGALLAAPVGGYARNTVLTPQMLKELKAAGHDKILVRSVLTSNSEDGGIYARDAGVRERGGLPPVGDYVGVAGAQGLSEPITQAMLSSKHSGGVAGAGAGTIGGFTLLNQLVQVPKVFRGGAAHAQLDGRVTDVEEAPQGGWYVTVGDQKHYVNRETPVKVKKGDTVEAGDVLSEGIPNPAEIVTHKGVGDGREYFVRAFRQVLKNAGANANRRNIELVARGLVNHVRLTDEVGDWAPDDVVLYSMLERQWQPRPGHVMAAPKAAVGKYLEQPVLHYTVGTRVRPSMLANLERFGGSQIAVHNDPPPFAPEMIRGMASISNDPDWQTRMLGSYQSKSLLEGARRGAVSDTEGSSFVPSLVTGTPLKTWKPESSSG